MSRLGVPSAPVETVHQRLQADVAAALAFIDGVPHHVVSGSGHLLTLEPEHFSPRGKCSALAFVE